MKTFLKLATLVLLLTSCISNKYWLVERTEDQFTFGYRLGNKSDALEKFQEELVRMVQATCPEHHGKIIKDRLMSKDYIYSQQPGMVSTGTNSWREATVKCLTEAEYEAMMQKMPAASPPERHTSAQ